MSGRIITINRLYGSNGRRLGKALSERLGIRFYDSELLKLASERKGIPYEELVKVDEKRASMWRYPVEDEYQMSPQYRSEPINDVLFDAQEEIIRELAETEDCIIVGRCATTFCGIRIIAAVYSYMRLWKKGSEPLLPAPLPTRKMPVLSSAAWINSASVIMNSIPMKNGRI